MGSDPTTIRSIAVSAEDLVAAVELAATTGAVSALRITPPFSGRMRARIHVGEPDYTDEPRPVHVPPTRLLEASVRPVPRSPETAAQLRADPTESYTLERHREYHATALAEWRRELLDAVRDRARIETPAGTTTVAVAVLGDLDDRGDSAEHPGTDELSDERSV